MNRVIRITFVILCIVVSSFSIEEIIIEATKIPTPLNLVNSSIEILTEQDLLDSGAQSLPDALISLPGVYGTQNGGAGGATAIYLRGGAPRYTLILIDGIRLNDSLDPNGYDLSNFDMSNIERVEILKGAQSSLYGADAMSGVINIITKKGSGAPSLDLNIEKGSYESNRIGINLSEGTESFYFNFGANLFENDGFSHTKSDPDKDSFLNKTLNLRIGGKTSSDSEWSISTRFNSADAEYDSGSFGKNQQISFASIKQHLLNGKIISELKPSYKVLKLSYDDGFENKSETIGFGWNNTFVINDNNTILASIENRIENFEDTYIAQPYDLELTSYLFAYQHIANEKLNFSISSRRDNSNIFNSSDTYQGSLSLYANENTRLRGAAGTSYLAPNGYQLSKSSNLEKETGKSYEIGIDHRFKNLDLDFDFTLFKNSFKQSIEYIPNTESYTNYSNVKISGAEAGFGIYPSDISKLRFSYTYLDSELDDGSATFINRKPRHKMNVQYQINPNDKLSINSLISYVDETTDLDYTSSFPFPTVTLSDYTLASINARYKINDHTEYYLNIMNVLDKEYETIAGYNIPELSIYSGIRLNF